MAAARDAWSDTRLDELSRRVDTGFERVDVDLRALEAQMDAGFERVNARLDALMRTMMQVGGGAIVALLGVIVALLGMIATQL